MAKPRIMTSFQKFWQVEGSDDLHTDSVQEDGPGIPSWRWNLLSTCQNRNKTSIIVSKPTHNVAIKKQTWDMMGGQYMYSA